MSSEAEKISSKKWQKMVKNWSKWSKLSDFDGLRTVFFFILRKNYTYSGITNTILNMNQVVNPKHKICSPPNIGSKKPREEKRGKSGKERVRAGKSW